MVNLKLSGLLDKGVIVQEQLIKILQRHEDALSNASSDTSYDDTEVKADISTLESKVETLESKVQALESAQETPSQTPDTPQDP